VGDKKIIRELGEDYAERLRHAYQGLVPAGADLVCYWFKKANDLVASGHLERAGLVSTNSIRSGKNREVLKEIIETGCIFDAWSNEPWVNDGAAVRVSLISFGKIATSARLDGIPVGIVHADLTASMPGATLDLTKALPLKENRKRCFQGSVKVGKFDIPGTTARSWLKQPNAMGVPNSDVLRPLLNTKDITGRPRGKWIIDFNKMSSEEAARYELPFGYVEANVKPYRSTNRDASRREKWWLHGRVGTEIRAAVSGLDRVIISPRVSKYRNFVWMDPRVYCDDATVTIARDDDTTFGILSSVFHEAWALRMCSYMGVGDDPRYTPTSCFDTFPFPEEMSPDLPSSSFATKPEAIAIAAAARDLDSARSRWINPPEWTSRIPEVVPGYPDRVLPDGGHEVDLKTRTLTNLYNLRPTWLSNLHLVLDTAVAAAYGWELPLTQEEILAKLFELNEQRSAFASL